MHKEKEIERDKRQEEYEVVVALVHDYLKKNVGVIIKTDESVDGHAAASEIGEILLLFVYKLVIKLTRFDLLLLQRVLRKQLVRHVPPEQHQNNKKHHEI